MAPDTSNTTSYNSWVATMPIQGPDATGGVFTHSMGLTGFGVQPAQFTWETVTTTLGTA